MYAVAPDEVTLLVGAKEDFKGIETLVSASQHVLVSGAGTLRFFWKAELAGYCVLLGIFSVVAVICVFYFTFSFIVTNIAPFPLPRTAGLNLIAPIYRMLSI